MSDKGEWISTGKALPDYDAAVQIAYMVTKGVYKLDSRGYWWKHLGHDHWTQVDIPTHWRYSPEADDERKD